ncbi:hypothetical protein IGI04_020368 [Brassica rapa subsp. trilocularis]|uniref:Rhodopsin n=1 Tax=Brassica rapa subsp. trilocularis TaxID=1813537 RepID=A0ABQ7MII9_BRACM|nr:hypothetical protein IGI04_020368 [Brassica rapa subsp. trilocularis]
MQRTGNKQGAWEGMSLNRGEEQLRCSDNITGFCLLESGSNATLMDLFLMKSSHFWTSLKARLEEQPKVWQREASASLPSSTTSSQGYPRQHQRGYGPRNMPHGAGPRDFVRPPYMGQGPGFMVGPGPGFPGPVYYFPVPPPGAIRGYPPRFGPHPGNQGPQALYDS